MEPTFLSAHKLLALLCTRRSRALPASSSPTRRVTNSQREYRQMALLAITFVCVTRLTSTGIAPLRPSSPPIIALTDFFQRMEDRYPDRSPYQVKRAKTRRHRKLVHRQDRRRRLQQCGPYEAGIDYFLDHLPLRGPSLKRSHDLPICLPPETSFKRLYKATTSEDACSKDSTAFQPTVPVFASLEDLRNTLPTSVDTTYTAEEAALDARLKVAACRSLGMVDTWIALSGMIDHLKPGGRTMRKAKRRWAKGQHGRRYEILLSGRKNVLNGEDTTGSSTSSSEEGGCEPAGEEDKKEDVDAGTAQDSGPPLLSQPASKAVAFNDVGNFTYFNKTAEPGKTERVRSGDHTFCTFCAQETCRCQRPPVRRKEDFSSIVNEQVNTTEGATKE